MRIQRATVVIMLTVIIAGSLRGPGVEAVETAEWIATTTKEMEILRLHLTKPMPQRPPTLVTDLMQQSDACYASFEKLYEDPRFNVIGEGDFPSLWDEQIALAKAMIAHEMVSIEALYKTEKKLAEVPLVEAYVERLKKREKRIDDIEFHLSGFNPDVAYALFVYQTLLRSLTTEPGHLERWRQFR
jgi:hypothetical protein